MFNISSLVNIVQGIGLIIIILFGSILGLMLLYIAASAVVFFIRDLVKEGFK